MNPLARHSDPLTSHLAAADVRPRLSAHRKRVLLAHAEHWLSGLTDFELAFITGLQQTSAGKRRLDLCREGLIGPALHTRPSPSGSAAAVWIIQPEGLELAARLPDDEERAA